MESKKTNLSLTLSVQHYFKSGFKVLKLVLSKINFIILSRNFSLVVPILFWAITMYPAILTPDSYAAWNLILNPEIIKEGNAVVTPAHIYFLKIFSLDGMFLSGPLLVQLILVYSALAIWVRNLMPKLATRSCNLITGLLFMTPFFGPFAMTIWKDVPHVALTMLGLGVLTKPDRTLKQLLLAIFALVIGAVFRYEGFLVLFVCSLILLCFHIILKKFNSFKSLLRVSQLFFMSAIMAVILLLGLQSFAQMPTPGNFFRTQSFYLDLEYVHSNFPETLSAETRFILNQVSDKKTLAGLQTCADPQNFYASSYSRSFADLHAAKMPKLWFESVANSNAREAIVAARICRSSAVLLVPFSHFPQAGHWPTTGMSPNDLKPDRPKIVEYFLYPLGWSWVKLWGINGNILGWPGLHLTLIIVLVGARLKGNSPKNFKLMPVALLVPIVFLLSRSLILIGTTSGQEFRYFAHVYFISLPITACLIYRKIFSEQS